ncbi:MAG: phytanoyl-CoA dioxygenase family protein [Saprospiraceae bacterium]|nr:phytanoyl-CoA dioxygenase family protein [Saprospiraceae bacterium]
MQQDLAEHHKLLSDLFPRLSAEEAWEEYHLSDDQVAFFEKEGYLSNVRMLDEEVVEQLRVELALIADPAHPSNGLFHEFHSNESEDPNTVLFHSLGHWRVGPGFHDVLWNPRFVVAASQLLGNRSVRFWHDQLFCKPPEKGGVVAWHQDFSYWTRTTPMQHLTCWVGLDDVSQENGCLFYVPGSHRWGLLEKPSLAGDMDGLNQFLNAEQQHQFDQKVPVVMKAGFGTFHHPLLVHGSYANTSQRARRAYVINVFADGTRSNTEDELLQGVPPIAKGKKIEGTFFPLLFDCNPKS